VGVTAHNARWYKFVDCYVDLRYNEIMSYHFSGLGHHFLAANNLGVFSGAIEATQVEKSWLTVQSENLIQSSKTSPPDNIIRDYNILLTKLNSFLSWTDTGSGWVGDPYSDSQSIRGNLASANRNALSRKATAAGQPAPAQVSTAPVKPVSVAVETVKNIPTEVKNIPTNVKTSIANSANYLKTQTRTVAPPDQTAAMNASASQLPIMCAQGNTYACQLAKIPVLTEAQKAEMAAARNRQAEADRLAIARRLDNVGQTQVAQAVRQKQDVQYQKQDVQYQGPSFTEVASGIASMLNPLASLGTQVATAKFANRRLPMNTEIAPIQIQMQARQQNNTPIIIAAVGGGILLLTVLVIVATR